MKTAKPDTQQARARHTMAISVGAKYAASVYVQHTTHTHKMPNASKLQAHTHTQNQNCIEKNNSKIATKSTSKLTQSFQSNNLVDNYIQIYIIYTPLRVNKRARALAHQRAAAMPQTKMKCNIFDQIIIVLSYICAECATFAVANAISAAAV